MQIEGTPSAHFSVGAELDYDIYPTTCVQGIQCTPELSCKRIEQNCLEVSCVNIPSKSKTLWYNSTHNSKIKIKDD
jgi:hypothetical protein